MAVILDGRVFKDKKRISTIGQGFYGNSVKTLGGRDHLNLKDPRDLAQEVIKAFIQSPQYLSEYADEATATAAGVKSGTIYKTPTGEIRVKL
jgi:hypothetical protein